MTAEDLASFVRDRRSNLGLRQTDLAREGGFSTETLRLVEGAHKSEFANTTLNRLDKSLQWQPGSAIRALRTGHPPTPLPAPSPSRETDQLALHIGRVVLALVENAKERPA